MSDPESSQQHISHLFTGSDSLHCFSVSYRQTYYALQYAAQDEFAVLDTGTTKALQALVGLASLRLQAIVEDGYLKRPAQQWKKGKGIIIPVSVNIYGSKEIMQDVGKRLSKASIYLQHPLHLDNVHYRNPHYFVLPGKDQEHESYHPSSLEQEVEHPEVLDIGRLFEAIDHTQNLQVWSADRQIRTPLLE